LTSCDQCRRFHNDRLTLRRLMAELETVGAPADFDFRLRARLARERPSNGFSRLFRKVGPITAVALLVLIGAMLVVVKNRMTMAVDSAPAKETAAARDAAGAAIGHGQAAPVPVRTTNEVSPKAVAVGRGGPFNSVPNKPRSVGGPRNAGGQRGSSSPAGIVPQLSTRESALDSALMIAPDTFARLVVVPVDTRELKLSIDNGRGGARMISLPPVTFGSQRLLAREASFVPASTARRDW